MADWIGLISRESSIPLTPRTGIDCEGARCAVLDKAALGSALIFEATGIVCLLELFAFFLAFGLRLFPAFPTPLSCFTVAETEAAADVAVFGVLVFGACLFCPFLFPLPAVALAPPPLLPEGVELLLVGGVEVGIGEGVR